jgi:hypothetical protein
MYALLHTVCPRLTRVGSPMTAPPDSNATGSTHPPMHRMKRCAARHGRWRTVKDRLGVKGSQINRLCRRVAPGLPGSLRSGGHRRGLTLTRPHNCSPLGSGNTVHAEVVGIDDDAGRHCHPRRLKRRSSSALSTRGSSSKTSKYGCGKSVLNPASGSHGTDTTTRTSSSRSRWPTTGSTPSMGTPQFQHEAVGGVIYRVNNAEMYYAPG